MAPKVFSASSRIMTEITTKDCDMVKCIEKEYYLKATGKPIVLVDHHKRILNHLFTPVDGELPYRTMIFSAPKKSAKTEIAAAVTYGYTRIFGGNCYSIANDIEQSKSRMFDRVVSALSLMREKNNKLYEKVVHPDFHKAIWKNKEIFFNDNRPKKQLNPGPHWLRYIASDYAGEAGGMPALTVWDELWAYKSESSFRLWDEMQPIPNLPASIRFITTYAGWHGESQLLWGIYEEIVKPDPYNAQEKHGTKVLGLEDLPCYYKDRYFVYWDHIARMPWHSQTFLHEAKNDPAVKGRESEFRRLWQNEWTTGAEAFLDMTVVDARMEEGESLGLVNNMEM